MVPKTPKTENTKADCYQTHLPSLEQALDNILLSLPELTHQQLTEQPRERSIEEAQGRVVAESITSPIAMPPWDSSAMDGYALKLVEDAPAESQFTIIGTALAGHPYEGEIGNHQAVRIMTGAPLPAGANSVIMQEQVASADQQITINQAVRIGQNVRRQGSELALNEPLIEQGTLLGPRQLALLASVGIKQVKLLPKLKVAIFTTGDELIAPGEPLPIGKIYDSNRLSLVLACQRLGFEVIDLGLIEDDPKAIEQTMLRASKQADVLLTSGGVSVGDADYIKPALDKLGQTSFWKVAIKPGKPILVGRIERCLCFGLPGNPVSTFVTFDQLAKPALLQLAGHRYQAKPIFKAKSLSNLRKKPGRIEFQRGFASVAQDGNWQVESTGPQGSARLSSMSQANCFIVLDKDSAGIEIGSQVNIQLFDAYLE
jgi:molybdopterin molybdotransferase